MYFGTPCCFVLCRWRPCDGPVAHQRSSVTCLENSLHAELMSIRNRPHGLIRKRRRRRKLLDVIILTSDFPLDTQLATLLGSKLKESRWNKEKRTHKLTRMRCSVSTRHWVVYGWKYAHAENMLPLTPSVRHPESIASDNTCMLRLFDDESHLSGTMSWVYNNTESQAVFYHISVV